MLRDEDDRLRAFCDARDAGDTAGMARLWPAVLEDLVPRVDAILGRQARGVLRDEHEVQDARSQVLERLALNVRGTFRGTSMGELVNTTKQLAWYVCHDVQRDAAERRRREGRRLQPGWDAEGDDGREASPWEVGEATERFVREQEQADAHALVHALLPQLEPRRRRVIELTLQGASTPEIMAELQTSADNVHQLRSRALKDLAKLMEDRDA